MKLTSVLNEDQEELDKELKKEKDLGIHGSGGAILCSGIRLGVFVLFCCKLTFFSFIYLSF